MNPLDFLDVAENLKCSEKEADIRTAIGRAYYAIFNYVRFYLAKNGLAFPNYEVHKHIALSIKWSGVPEAKEVGKTIGDLCDDRHDVDYEMEPDDWKTPDLIDNCKLIVLKAQDTIQKFKKCEGATLVAGARNYMVSNGYPLG